MHVLFVQAGTPFGTPRQALPHPPQWLTLVEVSTSQPSTAFRLQSPKGAMQALTPQTPLWHSALPIAGGGQTKEHEPQWLVFVFRFVSQPSEKRPLQSPKPRLQEATIQLPLMQPAMPFATGGQTIPHAPQLAVLEAVLVSHPSVALSLLQSPEPAWQVAELLSH